VSCAFDILTIVCVGESFVLFWMNLTGFCYGLDMKLFPPNAHMLGSWFPRWGVLFWKTLGTLGGGT
jgi:hypothetical protein